MTRMERRRRRRRILRIKLATTAAVLAMTTASIVALTGGAAETVPEPTPQPPALQAEPVLLVAEHDSTYQPVQMTAEPAQEPEPVEEEDENEKIEAALLEQGYESCEKFVTKTALFTGVFVGVTWLCTELFCEWNDPPYGRSGFQCSSINPKPFAIVYYAENKKRLVPMDSIEKVER